MVMISYHSFQQAMQGRRSNGPVVRTITIRPAANCRCMPTPTHHPSPMSWFEQAVGQKMLLGMGWVTVRYYGLNFIDLL